MIKCVPKTWGFAHVCDACGAVGPIRGDYPEMRDVAETRALGIACEGSREGCSAAAEGWVTGDERDLCPNCKPRRAGIIDKIRNAFA